MRTESWVFRLKRGVPHGRFVFANTHHKFLYEPCLKKFHSLTAPTDSQAQAFPSSVSSSSRAAALRETRGRASSLAPLRYYAMPAAAMSTLSALREKLDAKDIEMKGSTT